MFFYKRRRVGDELNRLSAGMLGGQIARVILTCRAESI